jgi:ionotropic glutamate receptor
MKETENSTIVYSLYAYDATRLLAYAIDRYIREGSNITFKNSSFPLLAAGGSSDLAQFKVFEGGPSLSTSILQTHFLGTSGYVQLNSNGDLNRTAFEILNIVDQEFKVVGYWTNETQLSASPPVNVSDASFVKSQSSALPIKWPGDLKEAPRGWVLPKNGRTLKIAVPRKIGFEQFLSYSVDNVTNVTTYSGYCIDVFLEALKYVPYTVPYYFELFGNESGPIYDDMIFQLAHKV